MSLVDIIDRKQTIALNTGESLRCVGVTPLWELSSGEMEYRLQECTQTMSVSIGMRSIIGRGKGWLTWRIILNLKTMAEMIH